METILLDKLREGIPQLTKEEAIAAYKTETYKSIPKEMRFIEQMKQELLFMPFDMVHESAEIALGRPVYTHEFAHPEALLQELAGERITATDPFSTFAEATGA